MADNSSSSSSIKAHCQAAGVRLWRKNPLKDDLRIQGIPQEAVLEDQGRKTKIQELVDKLRSEKQTKSVIVDLRKENSTGSVRNPKRQFKELGNIDLNELGDVSKKTLCPSCSKYSSGRVLHYSCGVCLRPLSEQKAQDQKSIRNLLYSVLHRENELLTRSETRAEPMTI